MKLLQSPVVFTFRVIYVIKFHIIFRTGWNTNVFVSCCMYYLILKYILVREELDIGVLVRNIGLSKYIWIFLISEILTIFSTSHKLYIIYMIPDHICCRTFVLLSDFFSSLLTRWPTLVNESRNKSAVLARSHIHGRC